MIHDLLDRTQAELSTLAVTGLSNAGHALPELAALSGELAAAGLGKLGERLLAIPQAGDDRARTAAWASAWAGVGLVRTRLLRPAPFDAADVLALPQAPDVIFPRPAGDLDSAEGLLAVLQGPDALARAYAAGRLAELGDEAVPALLNVEHTCGRCIRFLAIQALARIGTDRAVAGLIGLLGDGNVARPLETALLGLGGPVAGPVANALGTTGAKNKKRRQAAARVLWRLGAGQVLQAIIDDEDEMVKGYAQAALCPDEWLAEWVTQQSDAARVPAAATLLEHDLLAPGDLIQALDGLSKGHLAAAAAALWHTRAEPPVVAHYLIQMRAGPRNKDREWAAAMLTHLASPGALGSLIDATQENLSLVLDPLAEIADPTVISPLLDYAQSSTGYWRNLIARTLGRIGDPAAVPFLVHELRAANNSITRDLFEKALVAIGAPAVEGISQALLHQAGTKETAAAALERILTRIKTPTARKALAAYRDGTDELTRLLRCLADTKEAQRAVPALAQWGAQALEPLIELLSGHSSGQAKNNAALVLARLGPQLTRDQRERAIPALLTQLRAQPLPKGTAAFPVFIDNTLTLSLVQALLQMDADVPVPEIRATLVCVGVGPELIRRWEHTGRRQLLDVIVLGLEAPDTRIQTLHALGETPVSQQTREQLWPTIKNLVQRETDAATLRELTGYLSAWADPRALPLLRGLHKRWSTVTGPDWWKEHLRQELDSALHELDKKRSLKDRLLGK